MMGTTTEIGKARIMELSNSLAHMMAEYIEGARKQPPEWNVSITDLTLLFEKRLARFISADKISMILSEEASLQNGTLNTGYLAVKIAETCEGKQ
jgi:hypothetical protein